MKTAERRQNLKEALIAAAEKAIETRGLPGIKARDLAAEAGCATGAIYNVVADLDDLVLTVNARTLAALEQELVAVAAVAGEPTSRDEATGQLVRLALAYLNFAAAHTLRWRAVFEHHMTDGKTVPEWYYTERRRLFAYVEEPLSALRPDLSGHTLSMLARSVFSAVHGVVELGLHEKLGPISLDDLRRQTTAIVTAIGAGLMSADG